MVGDRDDSVTRYSSSNACVSYLRVTRHRCDDEIAWMIIVTLGNYQCTIFSSPKNAAITFNFLSQRHRNTFDSDLWHEFCCSRICTEGFNLKNLM